MPHNNKDPMAIRPKRMTAALAIYLAIFFGTSWPLLVQDYSALVAGFWGLGSGVGGSVAGIALARIPDWRCGLPQWLRSFFFRTLEHPWKETQRVGDYVEQYCARCERYRHGKMTAYDAVESWEPGPLGRPPA